MTTMMSDTRVPNWDLKMRSWRERFLEQPSLMTGEWQSQDISDKPMLATRELLNESFIVSIPGTIKATQEKFKPNLPWAEDHFAERVGGKPLNPPPSEAWWPHAQQGNAAAKELAGELFSHTYPERMWPKYAHASYDQDDDFWDEGGPNHGIRYMYGDLGDVIKQLARGPLTRQAFLPIWFPEDTGAISGQRVPCTLGYHFLIRNGKLQITYYIRSCDFIRHFSDDVYMAARLAQQVAQGVTEQIEWREDEQPYTLKVGNLIMHIVSFHIFEGDVPMLTHQVQRDKQAAWANMAGLL
jgi:hypothetical protein